MSNNTSYSAKAMAFFLLCLFLLYLSFNELNSAQASTPQPQVRVAVVYERFGDGAPPRTIQEQIQVINDTHPDLIFRAWFTWNPFVNTCSNSPYPATCIADNYSFEYLENSTRAVKEALPNTIVIGAIPAQRITQNMYDPITDQWIYYPDTWNMALDPTKWGINVTKEQFQCDFAKSQGWLEPGFDCTYYRSANVSAYFPDLTNPQYQDLFLNITKRSIDIGADGIWIDMFWHQAESLYILTGNKSHPSVVNTLQSNGKLINEIHSYGDSKGRYIYVGSWAELDNNKLYLLQYAGNMDFVTYSIQPDEVLNMTLNETKWNQVIKAIKNSQPNATLYAFMDWGWYNATSPMEAFSQNLSKENQSEFLRIADRFFVNKSVVFVYPLHGGDLSDGIPAIPAYGKYTKYDALAPEFQTYDTIKELAASDHRAPSLTNSAPTSSVDDLTGANRTFNITVNQTVNVTWYINGTLVQYNSSVNDAIYTNNSAALGVWNITAIANNINGTASQQWIWNVTASPYYNFSGYVTNKSGGLPLSGALVQTNTCLSTITNDSGFYNFTLGNRTYIITASNTSYVTNSTTVTISGADVTNANISLSPTIKPFGGGGGSGGGGGGGVTEIDTIGIYRCGVFYLKNSNDAGNGDITFGYGLPNDTPVSGDWNGDNITTIGVYRIGMFYPRNNNSAGFADIAFAYGNPGDVPVVGDWNGDGIDTIGVYRNGVFYLRNSNTAGNADIAFNYGMSGDIPIAGDWTGKGYDSVGVYRPSTSTFYLRNNNTAGNADLYIPYGISGDIPVVGDWDGNGNTTIGVYRPSTSVFYLRNNNTAGNADQFFAYGQPGDIPVVGYW
jgi:hypothetical protein